MSEQFGYRQLGTLFFSRVGSETLTAEQWAAFASMLRAYKGKIERVLIWSAGGNLTPAQRREAADIVNEGGLKVAVVSDSKTVRGSASTIGWETESNVKGFTELDSAAKFLDMDADQLEQVRGFVADHASTEVPVTMSRKPSGSVTGSEDENKNG